MPKPRTTPRKQPKQERSRATIDAILGATARILEREGFDHTSTNRVAEAAGVSIGSLYQYFPSKEALVAALVERHMEEMTHVLTSEMARVANAPLPEAVRRMVELMLRAHAVDPRLHKVLVEQVPRVGRLERVHEMEDRMIELTRAYLEAHRDEVRPRDLDLAAFIAVTTVEALTHAATIHHPRRMVDPHFVDEVASVLLRYLS